MVRGTRNERHLICISLSHVSDFEEHLLEHPRLRGERPRRVPDPVRPDPPKAAATPFRASPPFEKGENPRIVSSFAATVCFVIPSTRLKKHRLCRTTVRLGFDVVGLEGFDDPRDAELVVALGAVQRPDDEVDDAQVQAPPRDSRRRGPPPPSRSYASAPPPPRSDSS